MVDPHYGLLAACSLFIKGRDSFIFAASEHVQDLTVRCPGLPSRALRKIPRGQIHSCCQQPGNLECERAGNSKILGMCFPSRSLQGSQPSGSSQESRKARQDHLKQLFLFLIQTPVWSCLDHQHWVALAFLQPLHQMGVLLSSWRLISLFCD